MDGAFSKNNRVLDLYIRLNKGKVINKQEEAERFHVDPRSIQRDIDDIRAYMADEGRTVIYDRTQKSFSMTEANRSFMSNSEVLAISKILLESRAFTGQEMGDILDILVAGCVPLENAKLISTLIANEKFHYVELHHKSSIEDKLWEIGEAIQNCNLLEIAYQRQTDREKAVKRVVQPVAILFSEYYFYLNAFIVEKDEKGQYQQKYHYPAIFRLDRIQEYRELGEKFKINYADRFEEGEFRKRIQFMYAGPLQNIQFYYTGKNVEAILDRLPTAVVLSQEKGRYLLKAEVYGKGILMWLLSQGKNVEVLKPESLRQEVKTLLTEMLELYE